METNNKSFIGRIRSLGWGFAGVGAMLFIAGILFWGGFNTAMEWTNPKRSASPATR
jgi:nitrate/TMAO reductase-like tetraheme cytochrome c subunit